MAKGRDRMTSVSSAVRVAASAGCEIEPPAHVPLNDCDLPFWRNVVKEFARADWSDHQLEIAAMLARTMSDMATEQKTLRTEGFISVRENGTTVENPRARVCKSLAGDILSLRRSLALHARAQHKDNRDAAKTRDLAREIEAGMTSEGGDMGSLLN